MTEHPSREPSGWSHAAVRSLTEGVADGVLVLDEAGHIVMHNQAAAALFGVAAGELIGETPLDGRWEFTDGEGVALPASDHPLRQALADDRPLIRHSVGVRRDDGVLRWMNVTVRHLGPIPILGRSMSVTLERAAHPRAGRTLHALAMDLDGSGHAIAQLFEQQAVGMVHARADGMIVRANTAFASMLRMTPNQVLGRTIADLTIEEDRPREQLHARRLLAGGADSFDVELRLTRQDDSLVETQFGTTAIRDADGRCHSLVSQVVDVSRLRQAEHFVSRRALFDPLTQLINRTLLIDLLNDQLRVRHRALVVMAINLDRFKAVNDSLGQATGDGVLVEIAGRLRANLRPGDAAARISGDDFLLLCGEVTSRAEADDLARRVLDHVAQPIDVEGLRIQLTASAGIALIDTTEELTADEVMYQATAALAHAKSNGRARWTVFDSAMQVSSSERLRIEVGLRKALSDGGLRVAYQPLVDLQTGGTLGAEALLRWHDAELGRLAPLEFLSVAEECGLIVPVGRFVLGDALAEVARWRDQTGEPLHVAVNLSPNELNRPGISEQVAEALDAARLPSTALRLEITENVLVHADEQVTRNLAGLQALGVSVGIDDFGTGYASLTYLKHLSIDFVKIDRSFVAEIATSDADRAIVRSTIDLARALRLTTVAEGIETEEQLEIVRDMGCDVGQGYLLGRPEPSPAMLARFASREHG